MLKIGHDYLHKTHISGSFVIRDADFFSNLKYTISVDSKTSGKTSKDVPNIDRAALGVA